MVVDGVMCTKGKFGTMRFRKRSRRVSASSMEDKSRSAAPDGQRSASCVGSGFPSTGAGGSDTEVVSSVQEWVTGESVSRWSGARAGKDDTGLFWDLKRMTISSSFSSSLAVLDFVACLEPRFLTVTEERHSFPSRWHLGYPGISEICRGL